MRLEPMTCNSWQCVRMIEYVTASPGCLADDLARRSGWSPKYVTKMLTLAASGGAIACVRSAGQKARWYPAAEYARAAAAEKGRQMAAAREAERARRALKAKPAKPRAEDFFSDDKPIRLQVAVDAPLPFVCTAPCSVFDLGHAMKLAERKRSMTTKRSLAPQHDDAPVAARAKVTA